MGDIRHGYSELQNSYIGNTELYKICLGEQAIWQKIISLSGALPMYYIGNGNPLTDYLISGNTVQNGTPSPEAPVDVVWCGVWDETQQSYKLPLTVNGTEYPIYLGQTQSTRIISKIIITGSETNIAMPHKSSFQFQGMSNITMSTDFYCTHYANIGWESIETVTGAAFRPPNGDRFRICDLRFSSISEFKNYLVQQYQKGTPVTVFYVDTEARTSIRNSPLMKIGDYADTISFAQAEVVIPTVNGANVLDMTSTVKPSEVYIKGKGIKPTGYGQLVDNNSVRILDKNNVRILVHGQ